ncbi:AbrB/MazE/SpoVT family DNA-binding domain-containing protein [Sulfurimonas sp. RIFOXYB12_FULL_35_9]|jgi:antitoxin MazE|uniref:AbrB/MazE/SpoVT family DNA-binding domain-containing protein n=1 Tax=Sulfurimonas sp. RIFOXYB12_FULL_35_9 TaxID=1802256 RepID=UPI0008CC2917|nr:AbrB/MazE/SpoVT family DNA-binding domain-containing protein [Sulfurimonas sp. RIFOXYB12_FULL_35_9]MBS4068230.1 AbrB/MazE/SpoVT family DNA-binding domain-containing protein [Sulfurimonas sp.]MDX9757499.1 AbrB/MazE/SpoVT family DNA-binding domain-containing protein [Sulfurimonas sp.]OHE05910.1 MAG: transcriptional regulator/antitoxin MazE [Sulfurimonas sp. RIFOXYB12_FULL_35_9]
MTAVISKWGNSQGLRVPKDIMKTLHLSVGDEVNIFVQNNKAIIEPIKKEKIKYDINELVAKIPKDYQAKEEIISSLGREEW